ncbi:hypothetical protein ACFUEN_29855 [Streptomyces griseorubiginosus]|uniref:hypothetical protein n=1 Tax=Streptomyces TaxID=1883 RepID=UPI0033E22B6D
MSDRHHDHDAPTAREALPLDTARECFTLLVTGPQPLSVDCRRYAGLPNRHIPLDELRDRMLRRRCPRKTRDEVWAHLVEQSRAHGATWTLACAGMALPALSSVTRWLAARFPGDTFDLQAEVLSGFLGALTTIDLDRPRILVRLRWAAYRAGFAALSEALDAPMPVNGEFRSTPPRPPWGHPDLVLARAVRESVLNRTEADLIGTTRLEETRVPDWADRHGMTAAAAYKARRRAERRLVNFLHDQASTTDPDDPVASHVAHELSHPTRLSRPNRRSPRVTAADRCPPRPSDREFSEALSKPVSESGLLGSGGSELTLVSRVSSEVPRCV